MFQPGDLILFHGDSVTQQDLYTLYIESYLATRYPSFNLRFVNTGWSAHRSDEGLARFDRDVAVHRPQWVTIMFGGNDAQARPFEPFHLERFCTATRGMVERVREIGARPLLLTPKCVDMDRPPPRPRRNEILGEITEAARAMAREMDVPFVDVFHPMLEIQTRAKAEDPSFCFLPDGVHPNPVGHLCIAYVVLKELGLLDQSPALQLDAGVMADTVLARIPFPVDLAATDAMHLLPIQSEMAAWRLVAPELPAGSYEVFLNETPAGIFDAADLNRGVDLSANLPANVKRRNEDILQLGQDQFRFGFRSWREYGSAAQQPDGALAAHYAALAHAAGLARQAAAQPCPVHVRLMPRP